MKQLFKSILFHVYFMFISVIRLHCKQFHSDHKNDIFLHKTSGIGRRQHDLVNKRLTILLDLLDYLITKVWCDQ